MKNIAKITVFMLLAATGFYACQESDRITFGTEDNIPPEPPTLRDTMLLDGGGLRIYYEIPSTKDLLSIDAEYTVANGDVRRFSASYFTDSLDVLGMTDEQTVVRLYATDRSGNKSTVVPINVKPLESAVSQVLNSIEVLPAFNGLFVRWENKGQEPVNVFVTIGYTQQGSGKETSIVFSSRSLNDQQFISDLDSITTVDMTIHVEDKYGNASKSISKKNLALFQDVLISKERWALPVTNDTIGGIPMCYGNSYEGKSYKVIDGVVDWGIILNGMRTNNSGRTGNAADGNMPWNFIIDLGDYYELSRIVTHQMQQLNSAANPPLNPDISIGWYYGQYNVGRYNMYVWVGGGDPRQKPWNEDGWEFVSQRTIPNILNTMPVNEVIKIARAGDEAVMYPDNPHFTPPTRWFRYEAIGSFASNYTGTTSQVLSEITLYGKRK